MKVPPAESHLVLETPEANLVVGMKWLLGVYTKRFNPRHKEYGHLFARRYEALHLETLDAYNAMSTQALNSTAVQSGMKDILFNHSKLRESLRETTPNLP